MKIRSLQSMALLGNISRLSHKLIQKCNSIYCKVWDIVPMMTPQILYMKNFCLGLPTFRLVNDTIAQNFHCFNYCDWTEC